jgi:hypothetical protein
VMAPALSGFAKVVTGSASKTRDTQALSSPALACQSVPA